MPKHKIDITKNVMSKIKMEQIKMKPKWYFWLGSFAVFIAIVSLVVLSIFLISLITFSLRSHGPMGVIRYQQIVSSFPWWAGVIVIVGLTAGIFLLKKYDFSYKKNFLFIILIFIIAVLLGGVLVDISGLDTFWMKKGSMKRFYQQYNGGKQELNNNMRNNGWGKRNLQ